MEQIDAEMMSIMVDDFLADHAGEYEDDPVILDGEPHINEFGEWEQSAHDSHHDYAMIPDKDGNISIRPV